MALSRRAAFRSNLVCSAIRSVTASLALKISFALKARMVLATLVTTLRANDHETSESEEFSLGA